MNHKREKLILEKLHVLGTGNAMVTKCYNTCFALQSGEEYVLVDAGGGNGVLVQLEKANIEFQQIRHLIVTHEHCDHLLGVVWVIRKIGTMMKAEQYTGEFHIWCHEGLTSTIETLAQLTLQQKLVKLIGDKILIHPVKDGQTETLLKDRYTFFDIHSTKATQYGFYLQSGEKKITCLGDEPYNPVCEKYVQNSDWLLCEAFCLYEQREKFKPYEKHHSTVKEACELAEQLEISNLVLWHTEDKNYKNRKELYTNEGKQYYTGNLLVPYDLEVIEI